MLWPFAYMAPTKCSEVTAALLADDQYRILAGGTDLLVHMRNGRQRPKGVIDIKGVEELHELTLAPAKGTFIGAGITLNRIIDNSANPWKAVRAAAAGIATYQVRNRATLVGNLCHASPAADMAPPMLVLDAVMHVVDRDGTEAAVPLKDFFSAPQQNALQKGQWVRGVEIPARPADLKTVFFKKMRYRGHDCSGVNLAGCYSPGQKQLRLAVGACAPTPLIFCFDDLLNHGKAVETLAETLSQTVCGRVKPISDNRASAEYRVEMLSLFVKRAVMQLLD